MSLVTKKSKLSKAVNKLNGIVDEAMSGIQLYYDQLTGMQKDGIVMKNITKDFALPMTEEACEIAWCLGTKIKEALTSMTVTGTVLMEVKEEVSKEFLGDGKVPRVLPPDVEPLLAKAEEAMMTVIHKEKEWTDILSGLKKVMMKESRTVATQDQHFPSHTEEGSVNTNNVPPRGPDTALPNDPMKDQLDAIMNMIRDQNRLLKEQKETLARHDQMIEDMRMNTGRSERSFSIVDDDRNISSGSLNVTRLSEESHSPEMDPGPSGRHSSMRSSMFNVFPRLNDTFNTFTIGPREPPRSVTSDIRVQMPMPRGAQHDMTDRTVPYMDGFPARPMYNTSVLPPLKAQAFKGKKAKYSEFKTVYNLTIGNNEQVHPVQKLLYLRDLIPAQDQCAIAEYPFTEEGYHLVWEYLDSKYGDTESTIYELNRQFNGLKVESSSVQANMQLWLEAKAVAYQLQSYRAFEQASFIKELMNKFDPEITRMIQRKLTLNTSRQWTEFSEVVSKVMKKVSEQDLLGEELTTNRRQSHLKSDSFGKKSQSEAGKGRTKIDMTSQKRCIYCEAVDTHYSADCTVIPMTKRREFLRNNGRCETCTGRGHSTDRCYGKVTCNRCGGKHHRSLPCSSGDSRTNQARNSPSGHQYSQNTQKGANVQYGKSAATKLNIIQNSESCKVTKNNIDAKESIHSLHHNLPILFGKVEGKKETVPILLDCGAQVSLMENSLAKELKLPVTRTTTLNLQGFQSGGEVTVVSSIVQVVLEGPKEFRLPVNMYTMDIPVGEVELTILPQSDRKFLRKKNYRIPKQAEVQSIQPAIILGVDVLWKVLSGLKMKELPSGNVLIMTKLGSVLTGPHALQSVKESGEGSVRIARQCHMLANVDTGCQGNMTFEHHSLTEGDDVFLVTDQMQPDYVEKEEINKKVLNHFNSTIEKRKEGYYVVLPVKETIHKLKDNYWMALTRLKQSSEHIRRKQPEVFQEYADAINTLIDRQFIEEVPTEESERGDQTGMSDITYYLPHQAVKVQGKPIRIVFDGSSHIRNEASLNDLLYTGPLLLRPLLGILWSTRFNKFMISADVEKAFLQVHLKEESRNLVRFLWWRDPMRGFSEDNLVTFRFTRVPFGLSSSPFLLNATVLHHLSKHVSPLAIKVLQSMYVDNLILTVNSKEEIPGMCKEIKEMFQALSMNMRAFLVNDKEENEKFPDVDKGKWETQKILGVRYDPETDEYIHFVDIPQTQVLSKRAIAQAVAVTYDPLGLMAPLILPLKKIQQEVTKVQDGWDTRLSDDHTEEWNRVLAQVNGFEKRVPRMVAKADAPIQIILSCDASTRAIASTIHVIQNSHSHIVMAKSKIVSRDKVSNVDPSIPKLELAALALASTLAKEYITETMAQGILIEQVTFLSDSMIALHWLSQEPKRKVKRGLYTQNRIREFTKNVNSIRHMMQAQSTCPSKGIWVGHVPTELNPADCGTRGLLSAEFANHIWWNGPTFFTEPHSHWPGEPPSLWTVSQLCTIQVRQEELPMDRLWSCSNDLRKVCRVLAYMRKFIYKLKDRVRRCTSKEVLSLRNTFTAQELKEALKDLARCHQKNEDDLEEVRGKNPNLGAFRDEEGVWRCRGRLENSQSLAYDQCHPILIAPHSRLAELIIMDAHGQYHNGVNLTMTKVRERFWIPRLRTQVSRITRKCIQCQKMTKMPQIYPGMAVLPERRISKSFPFAHIGLDYFGPIATVENGEREKTYGLILTCLATRLIHLEIVPSMNCTSFLLAMRRYMGRRGIPLSVTCDNAPTFHLAENIMKEWDHPFREDEFKSFLANKQIDFHFITPLSPWKGGVYERMVGSVKAAFHRSTASKSGLTREELGTIFCEIEGMINTRPLTYPEERWTPDLKERTAIRPIDFISTQFQYVFPPTTTVEEEYIPGSEKQKDSTRISTLIALQCSLKESERVWNRWSNEYLTGLRDTHVSHMRQAGRTQQGILRVGQVVLIADEIVPRVGWKLAVIIQIRPSADGNCRELNLKIGRNKFTKRPPNKIIPLELDCAVSDTYVDRTEVNLQTTEVPPPKYMTRKAKSEWEKRNEGAPKILLIRCTFRREKTTTAEEKKNGTAIPEVEEKKKKEMQKKNANPMVSVVKKMDNLNKELTDQILESQCHLEESIERKLEEVKKQLLGEFVRKFEEMAMDLKKTIEEGRSDENRAKGRPGTEEEKDEGWLEKRMEKLRALEDEFEKLKPIPVRDVTLKQPRGTVSCAFCEKDTHSADNCDIFVRVMPRKRRCEDSQKCHKCLGKGHSGDTCLVDITCNYCHQTGHNTALCRDPERKEIILIEHQLLLQGANETRHRLGLPAILSNLPAPPRKDDIPKNGPVRPPFKKLGPPGYHGKGSRVENGHVAKRFHGGPHWNHR